MIDLPGADVLASAMSKLRDEHVATLEKARKKALSKAGIAKLTQDLALEWGRFGVRVVAVAPGPIEGTEGMSRLAPGSAEDKLKSRVPLGRYGRIDEVADAVLYLVSPAAAYVTGTTLLIDGGTSLIGAGPFLDLMG